MSVKKLAVIGMLGAISVVLGMTPLGFIPIGPTRATTMHIPVIIGAILEGPIVGGFIGLIFGLFSMYQNMTSPTPVSFVFLNPLVSVLPRVLIGVFTYYVYIFLNKLGSKKTKWLLYLTWIGIIGYLLYGIYSGIVDLSGFWMIFINLVLLVLSLFLAYLTLYRYKDASFDLIIPTIAGTLTNTFGVLGTIFILYGGRFVEAIGGDISAVGKVIFGIGLANGIPEMIIAIIVVTGVVGAVRSIK